MTSKLTLLIMMAIALSACKTNSSHQQNEHSPSRFEKHMDAAGPITIDELQSNYPIFSVKRHQELQLSAVEQLNAVTTPTQIIAYFGTWCHDSQREIPNLIKLKKQLNNPNIQLQLIALDRNKSDSQGLAKKAKVKYTPTIVVYQNQEEKGRIVESTSEPIEVELLNIIESSSD